MMTQFVEPQEMDQIANKQTLIHEYVENYVKLCTSQLSTQFSKSQVRIIENISTRLKTSPFRFQIISSLELEDKNSLFTKINQQF